MNSLRPHPATIRLLGYQATARWSRMVNAFRGPRRRMLSILAALLALVWVGQAVVGLLFRAPADPAKLRLWIPLGLLAYTIWHCLKAACRNPVEPFEWTPAEKELLATAPLRRHHLVTYRLLTILSASVVKALCFALVMLPDLPVWPAGFVGMVLALLFVDLLRMALEVIVYGMSRSSFVRFRVITLSLTGVAAGMAVMAAIRVPGSEQSPAVAIELGRRFLAGLMQLQATWIGTALAWPFRSFSELILIEAGSARLVGFLTLSTGMVLLAARMLLWLDVYWLRRRSQSERRRFATLGSGGSRPETAQAGQRRRFYVPPALRGAGALAWRQMLGLKHYRSTVLISLIIPAVLSCLTLLTPQSGLLLMIQLVGGLVFYTFLLLPTALKFDFRRDIDRLGPIKSLPISPTAVTIGELTVPVLTSTLFQLAVLLVALLIRPYHPLWLLMSVVVLLPVNVLIVSFENLLFMWFPYRLNQEGVTVFLRSILTFTAKGLVFAAALALALGWALLSKRIAVTILPNSAVVAPAAIFALGMWLATTGLSVLATAFLVRAYRRFDPSCDAPALS